MRDSGAQARGQKSGDIAARPARETATRARPSAARSSGKPRAATQAQAALGNAAVTRRVRQAQGKEPSQEVPTPVSEGAPGALSAFVQAPPTQKALAYSTLGAQVGAEAQEEAASFQQSLPELSAVLTGEEGPAERAGQVRPPKADAEALAARGAPKPQAPDLAAQTPPAPAPLPAARAVQALNTLGPQDSSRRREQEASEILDRIEAQAHDVPVSPGPVPEVPLEGAADPSRIEEQTERGLGEAARATAEAQQAVREGPGAEQVQPLTLSEALPIGELSMPAVPEGTAPGGMLDYLEQGLPSEVQGAFDEQQHAAMAASVAQGQAELDRATAERDASREAELTRAETESQRLSTEAQAEQEAQVQEQRERITAERESTLAAQQQALADVEGQVEAERTAQRQRIDERIQSDEGQIDAKYAETETQARQEVAKGEQEAGRIRADAEKEAEEESWWEQAIDAIADLVEALADAINAVFDLVREAVNKLLEAAQAFATVIIDAACAFVSELITAFADFLKQAVQGLLGELFPELAAKLTAFIDEAAAFAKEKVHQIGEKLKAGIAALCSAIRDGLNAIQAAFQAAVSFALDVAKAALTGDWSEVGRKMLEAALSVAGIAPEEFYAFIGSAMETLNLILDAPGEFLGNLLDAVVGGVRQFAGRFLEHLQKGFVQWLTGTLRGITLPETFDLAGVFSLVMQVLGLDRQGLRSLAVKVIGEENVERLEALWSYLETLLEGGFGALFERLQEDLGNLWDMVVGGLQEWLLSEVVMAAITKLASMFSPVGALVQAVLTVWNVYTFVRDQLGRLAGIVQAVVGSISQIAHKSLGPAQDAIEGVLAGLVPLAIDLLAKLLGLGGIGDKVQEIIGKVRQSIEKAVLKLVERIKGLFGGKKKKPGAQGPEAEGAEAGPKAAGDGEVGETLQFTVDGQRHRLWINVSGRSATVMVASSAGPVTDKIREWRRLLQRDENLLVTSVEGQHDRKAREDAERLLGIAEQKLGLTQQNADKAVAEDLEAKKNPTPAETQEAAKADAQLESEQENLQHVLEKLFKLFGEPQEKTFQQEIYKLIGSPLYYASNGRLRRGTELPSGYRWENQKSLPGNIERKQGGKGPLVFVDEKGILREGSVLVDAPSTGKSFSETYKLVDPSAHTGATARVSTAKRTQRVTPQPPPGRKLPGYVVAVTGVPGGEMKAIASRYVNEAWGQVKDQPAPHIGARLGVVAGLNLIESLDREGVVERVASGVKEVSFPRDINVDAFGFLWRPRWAHAQTGKPVDYQLVRQAYLALPDDQKQAALEAEKQGLKNARGIPYGLLREEVVPSPEVQQQVSLLSAASDPVYIHITDPDSLHLTVGEEEGGKGLLEEYDALLKDLASHPLLVSGGYNFRRFVSPDAPAAEALTKFANFLDRTIREVLARVHPGMLYPTEPNLLLLAKKEGEFNLFSLPSVFKQEDGIAKVKTPGALFGTKASEGSMLMRQLAQALEHAEKKPGPLISYQPSASIPTSAKGAERGFVVTQPEDVTNQLQSSARAQALAYNYVASLSAKQRAALLAIAGPDENTLVKALVPFFLPVSQAVHEQLGIPPPKPREAPTATQPTKSQAIPEEVQQPLRELVNAIIHRLKAEDVMARWQKVRKLLDDASRKQ